MNILTNLMHIFIVECLKYTQVTHSTRVYLSFIPKYQPLISKSLNKILIQSHAVEKTATSFPLQMLNLNYIRKFRIIRISWFYMPSLQLSTSLGPENTCFCGCYLLFQSVLHGYNVYMCKCAFCKTMCTS